MSNTLGNSTRKNRQASGWAYCCTGHDGRWKDYIKLNRKPHRRRERREWEKDYGREDN